METTRTLKGVDSATWKEFKSLAKERKLTSGNFLRYMIHTFKKKNAEEAWGKILNTRALLSEEEAKDLKKITKEMRKERGFRT